MPTAAQLAAKIPAGTLWTDPDFPPSAQSLGPVEDLPADVMWIRPDKFMKNPVLISGGVEPGDICQGGLGDCWFLGGLSVLASRADLLAVVVQPDTYKDKGFYVFRFYKFGRWVEICVDSTIPVTKTRPVFATGKQPEELWCMLIEKAFAKLHDNYNALSGGWVTDALVDMTGGVPQTILFDDAAISADITSGKFWTTLLGWYSTKEHLMGCARSTSGKREQDTGRGILQGHAYGILEVREYKGAKLIRCRNPWGQTEWTGPWSDKDTAKWTPETLKDLKYTLGDDGTFWIEYSEFVREYNKIYLCRLIDDKQYKKFVFRSQWKGQTAGGCANNKTWVNNPQFKLEVHERTEVIICTQQQDTRIYGGDGQHIGMAVFACSGSKATVYKPLIKTPIANLRETTITQVMEPGVYAVMPFTFDAGAELPFVISFYSKGTINAVSFQNEQPQSGSSPAPSGPPPAAAAPVAAADPSGGGGGSSGGGGAQPVIAKQTYEPDDNGKVGALARAYLEKLGDRYPQLKVIDPKMVENFVNQGEKLLKGLFKK